MIVIVCHGHCHQNSHKFLGGSWQESVLFNGLRPDGELPPGPDETFDTRPVGGTQIIRAASDGPWNLQRFLIKHND